VPHVWHVDSGAHTFPVWKNDLYLFSQQIFHPAGAAPDAAVKKDLDALQGQWTMKSGTADGFELPEVMLPAFRRILKGDELAVMNGDELIMKAKVTLDPTKNPKTIDYEVIDGPSKGAKQLGIYELNGESYKSCFAAPDEERPTEFSSKQGDHRTFSIWQRAKDQK
jgi:uncharacterized protein (TIGR03067 family)